MSNETIIRILALFATAGTLWGAVEGLFAALETGIRPEVKARWGRILIELNITALFSEFADYIFSLVNLIFGDKHFSWRCFWRSFAVSSFFIILLHFIFFFNNAEKLASLSRGDWFSFFVAVAIFSAFYNSLDFFMLWKTRMLLKFLRKQRRSFGYVLMIDILSCFFFGLFKYALLMFILSGRVDLHYFFNEVLLVGIPEDFGPPKHDDVIPGLFFYGTFFYAIFLMLYFLSVFLARQISHVDRLKKNVGTVF